MPLRSTELYRREEARTRVAKELDALDINVTVMSGTPKFEKDIFPRTEVLSACYTRKAVH